MPSGISTVGSGSELTREQVVSLLVEPLMAESVVLGAGPRIFTTSGGAPIRIPKISVFNLGTGNGASATYWKSENELIGEADPTYDEVTLLPSTLKSIKIIHRFSNELARLAVVDIANALKAALVQRVALAIDRAFLLGEGTNNTPKGLANLPGIQSMSYGTLDVDDIIDAEGLAMAANARPSVWFANPSAYTTLSKQREGAGSGAYLLQPSPTEAGVMRLRGLPVRVTTQLPTGTLLLADMAQVAVGRDLDASVTLLSERYADYDQLALRVVTRMDIAALNPAGIVRMTA